MSAHRDFDPKMIASSANALAVAALHDDRQAADAVLNAFDRDAIREIAWALAGALATTLTIGLPPERRPTDVLQQLGLAIEHFTRE